jgi:CO/xanthine dehydrogenase Mo-binding subunit
MPVYSVNPGRVDNRSCAFAGLPAKIDPLGIKGIRGAETIAAPPAVVNAVIDALKEFAVTHFDMPLISERVRGGHEFARRARVK